MFKKSLKQLGVVRILLLASFVVGLLFFGSYVLNVSAETKNAGPLEISYDGDKLFEELNIAPGFEKTKTISVKNNGSVAHSFAIAVSGVSGDLADVIMIMPKISGVSLWSNAMSLSELVSLSDGSQTVIGSILPGETKAIDLTASMNSSAGNDYQGKSTSTFSFIVGDQEPEPGAPTPPGGTGGGTVLGTGTKLAQGVGETLGVSASPSPSVSPSPSPSGSVEGEKDKNEAQEEAGTNKYKFLYWLIPIVVILFLFFLWWRRRRDEDDKEDLEEI